MLSGLNFSTAAVLKFKGQAQTLAGRPRRLQWRVIRAGPS